jgi:hypothetical protein
MNQSLVIDFNYCVMNKCLVFVFSMFVFFDVLSQETMIVFNEKFDNNNKGWLNSSVNFNLLNGSMKLQSSSTNQIFNFPSTNNEIKPDRSSYSISVKLKLKSINEGARSGIALADFVNRNTREMLSGYVFYFEKLNDSFFLTCHNIDEETPNVSIKLNSVGMSEMIDLKVYIFNSETGACVVSVNDFILFKLDGPMFNINQIGIYGKGNVNSEYSDIIVEQSSEYNQIFLYDLIDRYYDSSKETSLIYRGRYDYNILLSFVPRIFLCDNLYRKIALQSDFKKDDLLNELLLDFNCRILKSDYFNESTPHLRYYKLQYRDVNIVLSYDKETKYLVSSTIFFKSTNDAIIFFDEYIRIKKFKLSSPEQQGRFASHSLWKFSFISQNDNCINFLY